MKDLPLEDHILAISEQLNIPVFEVIMAIKHNCTLSEEAKYELNEVYWALID